MIEVIGVILGFVVSVLTILGFVYGFLRNFKTDINSHIDRLEKRMDILDERMFWLATGKTLKDAILEEKIKKE